MVVWKQDVGAGISVPEGRAAFFSENIMGTFALYENAAVLTHQNTVRKDRRFHKAPNIFRKESCPALRYGYACSYWVLEGCLR